jgi:hypothetical protein
MNSSSSSNFDHMTMEVVNSSTTSIVDAGTAWVSVPGTGMVNHRAESPSRLAPVAVKGATWIVCGCKVWLVHKSNDGFQRYVAHQHWDEELQIENVLIE